MLARFSSQVCAPVAMYARKTGEKRKERKEEILNKPKKDNDFHLCSDVLEYKYFLGSLFILFIYRSYRQNINLDAVSGLSKNQFYCGKWLDLWIHFTHWMDITFHCNLSFLYVVRL